MGETEKVVFSKTIIVNICGNLLRDGKVERVQNRKFKLSPSRGMCPRDLRKPTNLRKGIWKTQTFLLTYIIFPGCQNKEVR